MSLTKPHLTNSQLLFIKKSRQDIITILSLKDKRIILFVGPCSIHNTAEALDYAEKLKELQKIVTDKILLVMRVYVEKPRTTTGWKGFMIDPDLNGKQDVEKGILQTQDLLSQITDLEVPIATEFLHPLFCQFTKEYVSWGCIGARTVESQSHRELASSFNFAIGFKNATNGDIQLAANAIQSARDSHSIVTLENNHKYAIEKSTGNTQTHIILRGGKTPNYDELSIHNALQLSQEAKGLPSIVIDCSHANSQKDYTKQPEIFHSLIQTITSKKKGIKGIMVESSLQEGNQKIAPNLTPGVSITDSCISWDTTKKLIMSAYEKL